MSNRGLDKKGVKTTLSNCYVISPPEDNIESIFDCASKLARTYSYGGGCGIDISNNECQILFTDAVKLLCNDHPNLTVRGLDGIIWRAYQVGA